MSLTISILLSTAIQYFTDPSIFLENFPKLLSENYGVSIVFLLIFYILLQLDIENVHLLELRKYHVFVLMNLMASTFLLFLILFPKLFGGFLIILLTACITINIVFPSIYLSFTLGWNILFRKIGSKKTKL